MGKTDLNTIMVAQVGSSKTHISVFLSLENTKLIIDTPPLEVFVSLSIVLFHNPEKYFKI